MTYDVLFIKLQVYSDIYQEYRIGSITYKSVKQCFTHTFVK